MEEQLELFPLLTLTEMALRRTAILLWSRPEVLASVSSYEFQLFRKRERWENIENIVKFQVSTLRLPDLLMKRLSRRVTPVGLEIREWKRIHENRYCKYNEGGLPGKTKLCWTTTGRINYQETAKELFRNQFDVVRHYRIACDYCLEDYVALYWEKLPESEKANFSHEDNIHRNCLSFHWPHMLKGDYSKLDEWAQLCSEPSFNRLAFEYSAATRDKSAAEYFLKKLTHEEREASVLNMSGRLIELTYLEGVQRSQDFRGVCYLLTLMTPEQQMQTLREHPSPVCLSLFLDSVWPDPFVENAALIWNHLPPSRYAFLLRKIAVEYETRYHFSPMLFEQFFACSPPEFKKRFVSPVSEDDGSTRRLLSAFFKCGDSKCAGAVFRHLDSTDSLKLMHDPIVFRLFLTDILGDRWGAVEACLRGAELSERELERLKEELAEAIEEQYPDYVEWGKLQLESFFDFFHGTGSSDEEEGKRGPKRRLGNSGSWIDTLSPSDLWPQHSSSDESL